MTLSQLQKPARSSTAEATKNEKVVNCLYPNAGAVFRLICFPWAGGGSDYFAKWGQKFHNMLEVHSIRLAGRESRAEEPFMTDMQQVVDEVVHALLPIIQDKPFAFFGHSMGSYIAFMTALHLKEKYKLEPMHLFVSSTTAPHLQSWPYLTEEEAESKERVSSFLVELGGMPKNFNNEEFVQQCIPKLKADVCLVSNFRFDLPSKPVLSCGLTCFVGSKDIVTDTEAWKDVTSGSFDTHVLPGNHFYLMDASNETFLRNYITKCLEITALTS
ncbi:S-acyl fatty acid synthase thioesterase, medium chain [Dasypus novemcinctus]|uniref:S-acyl fatty acid synthase thioesterase, medium chain n=1 Tax=Dasypus novemcinctus TaxID=9361 RepID=UPI00062A68E5|nr:S-acyl fatty acid synthase thioesterase, medium chain [Dasypus novemcinctus]